MKCRVSVINTLKRWKTPWLSNFDLFRYKIDLNKEFSTRSIAIEVEKTRLEGDRLVLNEKSAMVEKMLASSQQTEAERERLKLECRDLQAKIQELVRERDDAALQCKEIQLKFLTQQSSTSLEFELTSLKR